MIDKIAVNQSKTEASVYYTNGKQINLYHSEGKVLDLIAFITSPMSTSKDITWNGLVTADDQTVSIEIKEVA